MIAAVKNKWGQPTAGILPMLNLQGPLTRMVGPDCMEVGMNCLADTQDTTYHMSAPLLLDSNDPQVHPVYAVVGTLAPATGNATYVGLGLNGSQRQLGKGNVSDNQMAGSARGYDPNLSDPDKYFVYYFTRDCSGMKELTGAYCFSVTTDMLATCTNPADPQCDQLSFTLRNYIRPGTQRGPDSVRPLSPVVIPLKKP